MFKSLFTLVTDRDLVKPIKRTSLEEDVADNGKVINENQRQQAGQDDGLEIARHRPNHIPQRVVAGHDVE